MSQPLSENKEGLLFADVDPGAIGVAKAAYDPTGHFLQPDVLRLLFNKRQASRVHAFDPESTETNAASTAPTQRS